jgi:hypothetical protein
MSAVAALPTEASRDLVFEPKETYALLRPSETVYPVDE